jgi:hypothetical protein
MELLPATPEDIAIFKQAVAARYLQRGVPAKMASALFNRHMLKVAADLGIKTSNVMSAPVAGPMPTKSPATTPIPPPKPQMAQAAPTATPGGAGANVTGAAAMGGAGMMTSMASSGLKKIALAKGLRKLSQATNAPAAPTSTFGQKFKSIAKPVAQGALFGGASALAARAIKNPKAQGVAQDALSKLAPTTP